MDIKLEEIEPQLNVSLGQLYSVAAHLYPQVYEAVARQERDPHPRQYAQEDALECRSYIESGPQKFPADLAVLKSIFKQARIEKGNFAPERETLLQAQAGAIALGAALKHAGHPGYHVY